MKTVLILSLCLGTIGGTILLRTEHLSWKMSSAKIIYNAQPSSSGSLYQTKDGRLLLYLQEKEIPNKGIVYILSPATKEAFLPNRTNHTVLPGLMITWHTDQGGVLLGSAKTDGDPQIVVGDNSFAFTTALSQDRVEIYW
jgi:hypothetical protein